MNNNTQSPLTTKPLWFFFYIVQKDDRAVPEMRGGTGAMGESCEWRAWAPLSEKGSEAAGLVEPIRLRRGAASASLCGFEFGTETGGNGWNPSKVNEKGGKCDCEVLRFCYIEREEEGWFWGKPRISPNAPPADRVFESVYFFFLLFFLFSFFLWSAYCIFILQ